MQVSFVIPLFNCLAHTQACLRTLQATLPAGLAHEIIFVDDCSTDGTREWLARLPRTFRPVLNQQNLGFAGACNRGAAHAAGDVLFFLNNDLVFLPGWLEPMLAVFTRFRDAGLVGNVQRNASTGAIDHAGVSFNFKGKPEHDTSRPLAARWRGYRRVPAVTGACLALRRDLWKSLGGFDELFCNGGEDVDLALRARSAGYQNYVSLRSEVLHHVSASVGRKLRDEQNSYRLFSRWRSEIAKLSAREWSRHHLATEWHGSRDPSGYRSALSALMLETGITRTPAASTLAGVEIALETEFQRWRELLEGAAPRPAPQTGRTDPI